MQIVRNAEEVTNRRMVIEDQLRRINEVLAEELKRPLSERRFCRCRFLDKEKKEFTARLDELNWATSE